MKYTKAGIYSLSFLIVLVAGLSALADYHYVYPYHETWNVCEADVSFAQLSAMSDQCAADGGFVSNAGFCWINSTQGGGSGPFESRLRYSCWAPNPSGCTDAGYAGTPPDCYDATCPAGQIGSPPSCHVPTCSDDPTMSGCACPAGYSGSQPSCTPIPTCASLGLLGTYPACTAPINPTCADYGQVGTYPACSIPPPSTTCADLGLLGSYPACYSAPTCADYGQLGTYPSCYNAPPPACVPDGTCTAANTCSGTSCTNNCGTVVTGTKTGGFCPVTPPPGGTCTDPTVSITASATRVNPNTSIVLTVTGSGLNKSCTVTGTGSGSSMNETLTPVSCNLTPSPTLLNTPPITTQSTFTVTCLDGPTGSTSVVASDSVIVNVNPVFEPF